MKNLLESIKEIPGKLSAEKRSSDIERQIEENIAYYRVGSKTEINERLDELDREWDVERTVDLNTAAVVLTGVILSATVSKKWLFLPALAAGFLARFAMQNGSTLFGGMRTRAEITREKTGLEQVLKEGVTTME
jgi:hypothetical protein